MIKKILDKNKEDWENFLKSEEQLPNKDNLDFKKKNHKIKKIDLHGFTLEEANRNISNFIKDSFNNETQKLIVITGKGNHSNNKDDPYKSIDYSILKHSVPDFIKSNSDLMKLISNIEDADIKDGGAGAFYIYLKKK